MFLKKVTSSVDLADSGLVKYTAQNMLLYLASVTERKPGMTISEIQVYKRREQLEDNL
jgi:hypothetical protein